MKRTFQSCSAALLFMAGTNAPLMAEPLRTIKIHAHVPADAGTVYMTGNLPELGPWDVKKFPLQGTGADRTGTIQAPDGMTLELKFTMGSWDTEGRGAVGTVLPNFKLKIDGDKEVTYEIAAFKVDAKKFAASWSETGGEGRLEYWMDVKSAHLGPTRHVEIWLPPDYDTHPEKRYQVLYMTDGQNLFDPRIANTGVDWGVDESVMRLVKAGKMDPIIVVGAWCTEARLREYSPWDQGPEYARFLIEELMPRVNAQYRTLTGPENTGTMGSSMGGLTSFNLCRTHPEVFGRGACLSTHWPWNGTLTPPSSDKPALIEKELTAEGKFPAGQILYFDYGTMGVDQPYEGYQQKVTEWLAKRGYVEGKNLMVKKFPGMGHGEALWRQRLDVPMEFIWKK